jgi:predicted nucleic acid-binding protein
MAKRRVFLDTSYVIALFNPNDKYHQSAKKLFEDLFGYEEIWITDAILFEIGDGLFKSRRDVVADFIHSCYSTQQIHVVETNQALLSRALDRFTSFLDKDWSLTDCLSFEVMAENGIFLAYSSDHHFEQAGFQYALH